MRANVYALMTRTPTSADLLMVCGSQDEAIQYYREQTGKPGEITERHYNEGHEVLILDDDGRGSLGYVAQYKVGIEDVIED